MRSQRMASPAHRSNLTQLVCLAQSATGYNRKGLKRESKMPNPFRAGSPPPLSSFEQILQRHQLAGVSKELVLAPYLLTDPQYWTVWALEGPWAELTGNAPFARLLADLDLQAQAEKTAVFALVDNHTVNEDGEEIGPRSVATTAFVAWMGTLGWRTLSESPLQLYARIGVDYRVRGTL